jgi:hypothetical protein
VPSDLDALPQLKRPAVSQPKPLVPSDKDEVSKLQSLLPSDKDKVSQLKRLKPSDNDAVSELQRPMFSDKEDLSSRYASLLFHQISVLFHSDKPYSVLWNKVGYGSLKK